MSPEPHPMPPADAAPSPPPAPAPPAAWRSLRDPMEAVRRTGLALALLFLAISLAIAYYSANAVVSIWFERQYVPIVRLVLALGIAATCVLVLLRLTGRRA